MSKHPHDAAIRAFGAEVRRLRVAAGLSHNTLSRRSGVSVTYISAIERGLRDPSVAFIEKLALGLGISPAELLGSKIDLSPLALEAAALFDAAPPEARVGVMALLAATAKLGPIERRRRRVEDAPGS